MNFEFIVPQKIIFAKDNYQKIGKIVKNYTKKLIIVTGGSSLKKSGFYDKIILSIKEEKIDFVEFNGIKGEPTPQIIDQATDFALQNNVDCVLAIGGGSVIDTAKALAGLVTNQKGVENYLEGVGKDYKIVNSPLPFIAVPTTAGSGAEVTKNSVVTSREKKYKKSFRDDRLLAKVVIADPTLTISLPQNETFFGGMDAICQLIESFVTKKKNNYCQSFSSFYIPKAIDAIKKLKTDLTNIDARTIMLESSIASGITLANSGLGGVHGFASGLGGMFDIPHGLICAILLPHITKLNIQKNPSIYEDLALLINKDYSNTTKLIDTLFLLNNTLEIPYDFKSFNISKDMATEIVSRSKGGSMTGNPVDFTDEELIKFIEGLL